MRIAWEAQGAGEPVLLIHGLGYGRWGWEPVAEPLAQRFRLLLFDNRGIGASEIPPGASQELIDRIVVHRLAAPPDPAGWAAQAAAGASFDAFGRLGEIAAPVLVLHGTEDGVVDPRNADLLAERIPHARVELFPGTGHLFF